MSDSESKPSGGLYEALGRVPSGIYILTVGAGENATGMLASWVQQAGFEPPMISLAIKPGRHVAQRIEAGEPFALNVVAEGDKRLLKHFGKGFEPGQPAFEGIDTEPTAVGAPALAAALAVLECRASAGVDASDHRVVVAHVTGGALRGDARPMVHVRNRADHY
ncbi:flavin reductase family protein [Botrimarina sp.]|uniref:flavin reductase family protein n=1 Tax=Botrimarina sp. TaxID=2795802 RepID=UPI0032EA9836